tara:strand:- start:195 stop:1163 length:969 start_codon:yes stop_codon:yes gene_type:complete
MSWFIKTFGTKKKKETNQSFKSTGLPDDWHMTLLYRPGGPYVVKELFSGAHLNSLNEHKTSLEELYNNWKPERKKKKESFGKKVETIQESKLNKIKEYIEMYFGSPGERKSNMLSNTAQEFKSAIKNTNMYSFPKRDAIIYEYGQYMKIKQNNYVSALLNDISRVWEWYYREKEGLPAPPTPPGLPPFRHLPTPSKKKEFNLPKRPSTSKAQKPPRKSSVTGKFTNAVFDEEFDNLHHSLAPPENQGWSNTNPRKPARTPTSPLEPEDDDWGKGGRKRRRRKSRKRKSNKRKRRKTRRKYKKKTRKRKNKRRRRKSRKRYKK